MSSCEQQEMGSETGLETQTVWAQEVCPGDVLETGTSLCCHSGQDYLP